MIGASRAADRIQQRLLRYSASGHVKVLTAARGACDRLIVGLNSDASVRRLKGAGRPVQDERARAEVLAALEAVDLVVVFEEDTPIELITRIKPAYW